MLLLLTPVGGILSGVGTRARRCRWKHVGAGSRVSLSVERTAAMDGVDQRTGLRHYRRILAGMLVLGAGILVGWLVLDSFTCTSARQRLLLEIPPYGGAHLPDVGSGDGGECIARYTTGATADAVLTYYEAQLPKHGWTVVRRSGPRDVPRSLEAARDHFHYAVAVIEDGHDDVIVNVMVIP